MDIKHSDPKLSVEEEWLTMINCINIYPQNHPGENIFIIDILIYKPWKDQRTYDRSVVFSGFLHQ
jgi:hypothetical protein